MADKKLAQPESTAGLSDDEVTHRIGNGQVNTSTDSLQRNLGQIIRSNVLTSVNLIMIVLFVLVVISGYWKDGLFVGVVISNSLIGVTQEVKARRELAKLEVVAESRITVIRNGLPQEIDIADIVLDESIELSTGAQVPVDAKVITAAGLQVDESLLTGEADTVPKKPGDNVLSGSFVTAGSALVVATAVGDDSYAGGLTTEAKTFDAAKSQLRQAIDRILRWLTIVIPIASVLLLLSLLRTEERWQEALQGTVAAAVAMVPDGLVLLTSLAFVAGVVELTKRKALAKQLSTVEVLARVDVLCLDKTGTITTGAMSFSDLHPVNNHNSEDVQAALAALAHNDPKPNATMQAIVAHTDKSFDVSGWSVEEVEPFSSSRKWSASSFVDRGWFYLGGPDMLLSADDPIHKRVSQLSRSGQRLLLLALAADGPDDDRLPDSIEPMAIVELEDEIRADASDILAYFADQDVAIKVISGDNHETVAAISHRAGLRGDGAAVDARQISEDDPEQLSSALRDADVFGRVAPRQKQAMVKALQDKGHTVAMTGDGVNDVLALKDADLGIAMGSGSSATRTVADLVLTDDAFSSLPTVVTEGRKVINNVERVASLFVTKAVYAVLLTIVIGLIGSPFPFLPRHLTLIGTFSIGVPGLFLALAPETTRVRSGFLQRVLQFSIPAGVCAGFATVAAYEAARRWGGLPLEQARTLATVTLLAIGLVVLLVAARPLRLWKLLVAGGMAISYGVIALIEATRTFFELDLFVGWQWGVCAAAAGVAGICIALLPVVTPAVVRQR